MNKDVRQIVPDPLTKAIGTVARRKHENGFSLLELILVMVLVGIAAVMVAPFVGHVLSNLLEGRELSDREGQAVAAWSGLSGMSAGLKPSLLTAISKLRFHWMAVM